MKNPYYDPQFLEERKRLVERLRAGREVLPPWEVEPNIERWKAFLGTDDALDSHFFDWQTWLPSLDPSAFADYAARYPEPESFRGFCKQALNMGRRRIAPDLSGDAYWRAILMDIETTFGDPEIPPSS